MPLFVGGARSKLTSAFLLRLVFLQYLSSSFARVQSVVLMWSWTCWLFLFKTPAWMLGAVFYSIAVLLATLYGVWGKKNPKISLIQAEMWWIVGQNHFLASLWYHLPRSLQAFLLSWSFWVVGLLSQGVGLFLLSSVLF